MDFEDALAQLPRNLHEWARGLEAEANRCQQTSDLALERMPIAVQRRASS